MASSFRQHLPGLVAGIGLIPISMGIFGVLYPDQAMETAFNWKSPSNPDDKKLVQSLMRLYSFRSLGFGLVNLAVWYAGSPRAQGAALITGVVVALGDGWTCYHHTDDVAEGMKHWYFAPVSLGLGAALLGWI